MTGGEQRGMCPCHLVHPDTSSICGTSAGAFLSDRWTWPRTFYSKSWFYTHCGPWQELVSSSVKWGLFISTARDCATLVGAVL